MQTGCAALDVLAMSIFGSLFALAIAMVIAMIYIAYDMHKARRDELKPVTAVDFTRRFRELYEQKAPQFGYDTGGPDPSHDELMHAVCIHILHEFDGPVRWKKAKSNGGGR